MLFVSMNPSGWVWATYTRNRKPKANLGLLAQAVSRKIRICLAVRWLHPLVVGLPYNLTRGPYKKRGWDAVIEVGSYKFIQDAALQQGP